MVSTFYWNFTFKDSVPIFDRNEARQSKYDKKTNNVKYKNKIKNYP